MVHPADEMIWTVQNLLDWSVQRLKEAGIENPKLEAEMLLGEATRSSKENLYIDPGRSLTEKESADQRGFVERRCQREPIFYILGRREFWSMEFKVSPAVLIPRPETELLIEQLLKICEAEPDLKKADILDIGTGSGILAVVAAKELSGARVVAVDISGEALEVARSNANRHQVADRIQFAQGDLFEALDDGHPASFDIIFSNPPYIKNEDMNDLETGLRDHEPEAALLGGEDGMDYYERIIPEAVTRLNSGGALILEIGMDQAKSVSRLVQCQKDFSSCTVIKDYSGLDRVVVARRSRHG